MSLNKANISLKRNTNTVLSVMVYSRTGQLEIMSVTISSCERVPQRRCPLMTTHNLHMQFDSFLCSSLSTQNVPTTGFLQIMANALLLLAFSNQCKQIQSHHIWVHYLHERKTSERWGSLWEHKTMDHHHCISIRALSICNAILADKIWGKCQQRNSAETLVHLQVCLSSTFHVTCSFHGKK